MSRSSDTANLHVAGPFKSFDHAFQIATDDEALRDQLRRMWAGCRSGVQPTSTYRLRTDTSGVFIVEVDECRTTATEDPSIALRDLTRAINAGVVGSVTEGVVLHAAGAVLNDRAVVLPAAMEAGKSTLVAGLVERGWDYLSDEAIALRSDDLTVCGYPKPIALDPGSWAVLPNLRPRVEPRLARWFTEQWQVGPEEIRPGATWQTAPLQTIVIPQYRPGHATALERLARVDGVMALGDSCFTLVTSGQRSLDVLAATMATTPCYRLTFTDLPAACEVLAELLAD